MKSTPELISLCKIIADAIKEAQIDKTVKESVKEIGIAFKEKNAKSLHDIFNS